ncbi:SET and MYND domain-containing protein 4 [Halotydeus destructor]|nr:SET and MYND domain-containing protein 4 [Halotydeus destructor]
MATGGGDSETSFDLIGAIKSQSKVEGDQLFDDGEWSLFTRVGESIFRVARKQMSSDDVRKEQMDKFVSAANYQDKVKVILEEEQFKGVIEMLVNESQKTKQHCLKNVELARTFREEGNKLFGKKLYKECIEKYNSAIKNSPTNDQELVLAMANRSAAFYHLDKISDCLEDIEYVLEHEYPHERLYMIYSRKILSLKKLGKQLDATTTHAQAKVIVDKKINDEKMKTMMNDFVDKSLATNVSLCKSKSTRTVLTTLKQSNPKMPKASLSLTIKSSKAKGRFLETVAKVEASEVLIKEPAYSLWVKPSLYSSFCYHCSKNVDLKHCLPSRHDCLVLYCSKTCESESWTKYHHLESQLMNTLQILSAGHLALRVLLTTGVRHAVELAAREGSDTKAPYTGGYLDVLTMVDNVDHYSPEHLCAVASAVAFLATLLKPEIEKMEKQCSEKLFKPFCGLLLKHVLQFNSNSIGIHYDDTEVDAGHPVLGSNLKVIGLGIFPTCALLNHSCDKKVYTLFDGSSICLKSVGTLESGSEVTLCYGPFYRKMATRDRKDILKKCYFFDCKCSSCSSKQENLGAAFACLQCKTGPLIVHADGTSYCSGCKLTDAPVDELLQHMQQTRLVLEQTWPLVVDGKHLMAEDILKKLMNDKGKFFYKNNDLILEIKEKLAYIYECQKKLRSAAKLWLDCYYGQLELDGFDDSYEALFYLLKITSSLVEEADGMLDQLDKVKISFHKATKYFARAMSISKKLQGKECRVLEARSDLLEQMPEPTVVAKDLQALENYLQVADEQISRFN